jgi:hypothetical protein
MSAHRKPPPLPSGAARRRRLRTIQRHIAQFQYICSGTVSHQVRQCGKPTCACATDPAARHGPYYLWSRREESRQVNTMLPRELGPFFEQAVDNYRKLRDLLKEWERASAEALLAMTDINSQPRRHLASERTTRSQRAQRRR